MTDQTTTLDGDVIEPGMMIRENRQWAPVEEVMTVNGNMISTYAGRMYHCTKIVLAK